MQDDQMQMSWGRFAAMILTSTGIMFFLMYQLVFEASHATFSINRLVASVVMGFVMTAVMLGFMWPMYKGKSLKIAVLALGIVGGIGFLAINRSQTLVGDTAFMKSMIPHHSIAINNASKAKISDPRVRELADRIIESQLLEIEEMKLLLEDIERNGERGEQDMPARTTQLSEDMRARAQEIVE